MPVKPVYKLTCKHCHTIVCSRGMKAILLADASVQLFSTDTPSPSVYLLDKDYLTRTCHCRIRDVSCTLCGNIIGYHVVSPCHQCLKSSNNGHFWMFHSQACDSIERLTATGKELLIWNNLPGPEKDIEFLMSGTLPYDQICR
ncbi:protein FAM72 [Radiomyces spectabilis]|uniref:protein FAM72 n=1 Tax=Radiomyces spectabilis TaxID=64574 RepID=UPI00221FBB3E|nr:protein FAM72 [Radiomyces spectabilis]KAI8388645.1 protein FAM72 [Radiomyces spectabilis]